MLGPDGRPAGQAQAAALADRLAGEPLAAVYASPLRRALPPWNVERLTGLGHLT